MQLVHCHRKGAHLNTIERFHIHTEFVANNHLNDPPDHISKCYFQHPHKSQPVINRPFLLPTPFTQAEKQSRTQYTTIYMKQKSVYRSTLQRTHILHRFTHSTIRKEKHIIPHYKCAKPTRTGDIIAT